MDHVHLHARRDTTLDGRVVVCYTIDTETTVTINQHLGLDQALEAYAVASTEFSNARTPGVRTPSSVRIVRDSTLHRESASYAERDGAITIRVRTDLGTDDALNAVMQVMERAANQEWPQVVGIR